MINSLIDKTLTRIAKNYRPGTLKEMEMDPEIWSQLLHLEKEINKASLLRDEERLSRALQNYELLIVVNTIFEESRLVTEPQIVTVSQPLSLIQEENMKRSERHPSRFFSKEDFPEPRIFTIDACEREEIKTEDGKEDKTVLYFTEADAKPLILNRTNDDTISDLYGDESDDWHGKEIELFMDKNVKFGSQRTGGIRVRAPEASGQTEN